MEDLTPTENKILELRQKEGLTIEETIKKAKITRTTFEKIVKVLKDKGYYNEEEIKKAKRNKKSREYYHKHKNEEKLPKEELEYRQKCIDILSIKYFNYNETKQFNPILVSKLSGLYKNHFSYKVIYNTILLQEKSLNYAMSKPFGSEYQKINYMIAIIKNNLKITWKKLKRQEDAYEGFMKKNNDQDIVRQLNKTIITKPTKKIDMTDFLD